MGAQWLFMQFSLRSPSHMRSSRLDLRGAWLVMGSLQERERDVKPKGHLTPNDTLGEEGRVTEMVMEEECPSICLCGPHSPLPPFFCIHRVKVFPLLDCIVHESLLSSPLLSALAPRTEPDLVNVRILSQFWCQFMGMRVTVQSYELDGLSGETSFYIDLIPNFPFSNPGISDVF